MLTPRPHTATGTRSWTGGTTPTPRGAVSPRRSRPGSAVPDFSGKRRHRYYHRLLIEDAKRAQTSLEVALSTRVAFEEAWAEAEIACADLEAERLGEVYPEARRITEQHSKLTAAVGSTLGREPRPPRQLLSAAPGTPQGGGGGGGGGGARDQGPGSPAGTPRAGGGGGEFADERPAGTPRALAVQNPAVWSMPRPPTRAESHGEKVAILRRRVLELEAELAEEKRLREAAEGRSGGAGSSLGTGTPSPSEPSSGPSSKSSSSKPSTKPSSSSSGSAATAAAAAAANPALRAKVLCAGEHLDLASLPMYLAESCPETRLARHAGRDCEVVVKIHFSRDPNAGMQVVTDGAGGKGSGDHAGGAGSVGSVVPGSSVSLPFTSGMASPSSARTPPVGECDVYISYCPANASRDGGRGGSKPASGTTDVFALADAIEAAGAKCWISSHPPSLEQAVGAMQRCRAVLVFVSDDYARDERCLIECKFACGSSGLPVLAAAVGPDTDPSDWAWRRGVLGKLLRDPIPVQSLTDATRSSFAARAVGFVRGTSGPSMSAVPAGGLPRGVAPPRTDADSLTVLCPGDPVIDPVSRTFTGPVRAALEEVVARFAGSPISADASAPRPSLSREAQLSLVDATSATNEPADVSEERFAQVCREYGSSLAPSALDLDAFLALLYYKGERDVRRVLRVLGYSVGLDSREAEAAERAELGRGKTEDVLTADAAARALRLAGLPAAEASDAGTDAGYYGGSADATRAAPSAACDPTRHSHEDRVASGACAVDAFVSYAWADSREAAGARTHSDVDPRAVCDALHARYGAADLWVDVRRRGEACSPEERRVVMARSKVFIAFLSEQYAASPACVLEFKYAVNVLRMPLVAVVVGELAPVTTWSWMAGDLGEIIADTEFFDFQNAARLGANTERFADHLARLLEQVNEDSTAIPRPSRAAPRVRLGDGSVSVNAERVYTEDRSDLAMPVRAAIRAALCAFTGHPVPSTLDDPLPRITFLQARRLRLATGPEASTMLTAIQFRLIAAEQETAQEREERPEDESPANPSMAGEAFIRMYKDIESEESIVRDLVMLGFDVRT